MSKLESKSPLPLLRSPSHESINTSLSVFSVSSTDLKRPRGPSPNPVLIREPPPFEEDADLLRTCAQLSAALGLRRSFSASELSDADGAAGNLRPRNAVSELVLCCQRHLEMANASNARLQNVSRSCSTWVAIGEPHSNLPSPHSHGAQPFTPADLVRSVNKRVRSHYLHRRLLATCRALERMSSDMDSPPQTSSGSLLRVPGAADPGRRRSRNLPLTIRDIEKEKGKPLSKYERNVMIFNWLHTLEDAVLDPLPAGSN
ncbi:uncharacterized protein LOC132197395 [Neocloeon triangulifer]|uniref:uncharacterized protein LOC132197395 n=1 Tax=Neocloeon triangulifer TaxID=2078957 RepID=UPI00286EFCBE|nr:uncharacterized protein LOC132197395 [Neocloeon triangulifer]